MKTHTLRTLAAAALACTALAASAAYPDRPIKVIVFLPPGSGPDNLARVIGAELAKTLQQPVVVENRPGASGGIALGALAKSPADGYTLGVVASGPMAINVGLIKDLPYDPRKDFTAISEVATSPNVLVVGNALGVNSVAELAARGRAHKQALTYSSGGSGTVVHLAGAQFSFLTDIDARHIPYKGTPQGIVPVITGEVSYGVYPVPNVASLATEGKLKALAVTSPQRSAQLPDVPTTREAGFPNYTPSVTYGVIGPARLPPDVVARLHAAIVAALGDASVKTSLTRQGFEVGPSSAPEDYRRKIAAEIEQWVPIVQRVGAQVD